MAAPTQHTYPSDEGTPEEEFLYLLGEGSDLLQAGRLDDAKREIERALAMRPGHEQAKNLLGLTLFRLGDLDPAQAIFDELVHDNPVEPSLRLNLAMVHLKAGRLQAAREELERALDLNPDHKRAASYMAMVCDRLGRLGEAADWYLRAGNKEQAAALKARALASAQQANAASDDDGVPEPPAVMSAEGAGQDERMPDPRGAQDDVFDSEVQAAALTALRAEALARPSAPPSAEDAVSARQASQEFTLDLDDGESADADDEPSGDGGYVDPFTDEPVEATKPYAPNPYFNAGGDVVVSVREISTPTKREPALRLDPAFVAPDDVELRAIEPVEKTLPYASVPKAPAGRAPLRDDAQAEAIASPPPSADDSVPDGVAPEELLATPPPTRARSDEGASQGALPRVAVTPPRAGVVPAPVDAPEGFAEITSSLPSGASSPGARALPALTLATLGAQGAAEQAVDPFVDADGLLVFPIAEAAYLRTDLLVGLRGSFEVEPVYRRYRGRRTDSFFGGGKSPLAAALGDGRAWLDAAGAEVTVLSLADEELYLVEGTLLAFSSGLVWENGRLPEPGGRDLDIVHLRGSGRVVLQTKRKLRAIETGDHPVTVAASRLVGWAGALVPSRGLFPGLPDNVERPSIVRFEGSGRILVV